MEFGLVDLDQARPGGSVRRTCHRPSLRRRWRRGGARRDADRNSPRRSRATPTRRGSTVTETWFPSRTWTRYSGSLPSAAGGEVILEVSRVPRDHIAVAIELREHFEDVLELVVGEGLVRCRRPPPAASRHRHTDLDEHPVQLGVVLHILLLLLSRDLVKRRLGDVDVTGLDEAGIWRQKKVSRSVRMWAPSMSASVMMTIL